MKLNREETDFWYSLSKQDYLKVYPRLPPELKAAVDQVMAKKPNGWRPKPELTEREKQRQRMAEKRAKERDLAIPIPADPGRRLAAEVTAERWLTTYFAETFHQPFTEDRSAMLESVVSVAEYGGDQAIAGPRGEGKALALDTPIPVPNGMPKTMGELSVGDVIFGGDGRPCVVTYATEVQYHRECFRVTFSDGEEIVADREHLWKVNQADRKAPQVLTTGEMLEYGLDRGKRKWFDARFTVEMPIVRGRDMYLHVDPYVLGIWLGDGSTKCAELTAHVDDWEHYKAELHKLGLKVGKYRTTCEEHPNVRTATIGICSKRNRNESLHVALRNIGVLNCKHVPSYYLSASASQRLNLLQGLMDTDGSISHRGQCEYSSKLRHLCESVSQLVSSLGMRTGAVTEKVIDGTTYYRVRFTPPGVPVFRLSRKQKRVTPGRFSTRKSVRSIERVDSVPVRCIQVSSPDSTYLCGTRFTVTHNTRIAMYGSVYLMVTGKSTFPIVVGKSQSKSVIELKTIIERLRSSPLFLLDYPEIAVPFQEASRWSSKARMLTIGGEYTGMEIAADHFIFPTITRKMLGPDWPEELEPAAKGQIMSSLGIDGPIRGTNYYDRRPTIAILDDIENRESANSPDTLIPRNIELIEEDIGGLGGNTRRVARVMLCTTQNQICIAYRYTDPKQYPSWRGVRYRKLKQAPANPDLWQEYLDLRRSPAEDDPDFREAFRFYQKNQAEMDRGAVMSNPHGYDSRLHRDGHPIELSALQAYYNKVADFGQKAVSTEDDNDPPKEVGPEGLGLDVGKVISQVNGFARKQLPANTSGLTVGVDIGKWRLHWVAGAWWKGAGGAIVDYDTHDVAGQVIDADRSRDIAASEPQIYRALLDLRSKLLDQEYVDATGERREIDQVFIDSGTFTNAAYEFCRQVGAPFFPTKGIGNYRQKKTEAKDLKPGDHMHAQYLQSQRVWLFELDADYWKNWVHERYLSPVFDESNMLLPGALSLYDLPGRQKHLTYANHITAEELVREFREGKGAKTYWNVLRDENHYLDATALAAAAGRRVGIKLIGDSAAVNSPREVRAGEAKQKARPRSTQHGRKPTRRRFITRPGGWIGGIRK